MNHREGVEFELEPIRTINREHHLRCSRFFLTVTVTEIIYQVQKDYEVAEWSQLVTDR